MGCSWEALDVRADLGEQDLGCPPTDAGDRVQTLGLVQHGLQTLIDLLVELLDHLVQSVQVRQLLAEQELLVSRELPRQRTFQLRTLAAQAALAMSASSVGSDVPPTNASSIWRPERPSTLLATSPSLMPAPSSVF